MPDKALQSWPRWNISLTAQPTIIAPITGGRTNRSFLVDAGGSQLVLRINATNSEQLGINRHQEATILQAVSTLGLAPEVFYCSPEQGLLVTEYIAGSHWQQENLSRGQQASLAELLQRVHQVDIDLPKFDYRRHLESYWHRIVANGCVISRELEQQRMRVLSLLDSGVLETGDGEQRLCHHDPGPQNLLERDGQLFLLDWEYAGMGNPRFDTAAMAADWHIDPAVLVGDSASIRERLTAAMEVYKFICVLWEKLH